MLSPRRSSLKGVRYKGRNKKLLTLITSPIKICAFTVIGTLKRTPKIPKKLMALVETVKGMEKHNLLIPNSATNSRITVLETSIRS